MFWRKKNESELALAGSREGYGKRNRTRQGHATETQGAATRPMGSSCLTALSIAALTCLGTADAMAQSYVPPIVATGSTTLYSSATVITPGRVAADKAGNVFYVATGSTSSSLMEVPAASQTGMNAAPVTLVTGLGSANAKAVVVDVNGNLWVTTGNQESTTAPGATSTDYVSLVEIPALNGIPNTALAKAITLGTADATHCTATGTAVCTVQNYKLNDSGSVIAGPQALDFYIDGSGNITYIDIYDNNLPSGDIRIAKRNVYNGGGSVLYTGTADTAGQVTVAGDGNTYYCSPSAAKVSLVSGGALTTVGVTSSLGAAAITAPTGISSGIFGNLYISSAAQLSEVPLEGAKLNFVDEFGIISSLTSTISSGGGLDQNGNYYYAYNSATLTDIQQLQVNGFNFGKVPVGSLVNSTSTPPAPSLNLYVNVAPSSSISSYFPTGSPTTNTTALYLQSFPYSGTKSFAGGSSFSAATDYTITMDFQPIHPGLLRGSFTPRSGGADAAIINLQGTGVGPEPLFFPGTPSLLFTAAAGPLPLNAPEGLAVDAFGDIFVADTGNGKVVADCIATTTDNEDGTGGSTNNTFCPISPYANAITQLSTGFVSPVAIALDGSQSLYVLDSSASGTPLTVVNGQFLTSELLVTATTTFGGAALKTPMGLALDGFTNIYIADTGNNRIVEAHQFGATQTDNIVYVPSTTTFGGTALSGPTGLAVDANENLYIADTGNNRIVEYSAAGVASVISTGTITLNSPYSVKAYPSGELVVSDKTNGVVLVNGTSSSVLSFGTAYTTTGAKGVALDATGNIYLSNTTGNQVLELNVTSPQAIAYPNTNDLAASANNTETVADEGNANLVFTGLAVSNSNFTLSPSSTCTSTATVSTGSSCTVVTEFTPQSVGPQTGSVTLTDNQLAYTLVTTTSNETASFLTSGTQTFNLTGTATSAGAPQTITFPPPASPIAYTATPITLSATASSGLAVTFSVLSGPGTVSGNMLSVTGVGTIVVAANQAGSVSYSAAPQVMQSIVVNQAAQTITFTPTSPVIFTTNSITLAAGASSGLTVTFTVVSGPGIISGNTLNTTGVGTIVIAASQAGNADFTAAPTVQASIVVNPVGTVATPVLSLAGGTYNASYFNNTPTSPVVFITDTTPGALIYYTTNGTTPTTSSNAYTATVAANGITPTGTETVQAIAVLPPGYANSAVASATYTILTTPEGLGYTLSPASLTLQPGASGTINITVTPMNGINATINFGCTGLPVGATCTFAPATLTTLSTQGPVSTILTVTAPKTVAANTHESNPLLPGGVTLAFAVCLWGWRKRDRKRIILLLLTFAFCLGLVSGCGSSNANQASKVTVAISGDSVRDTATFTLNVP